MSNVNFKRPNKDQVQSAMTRIAIVNNDRCKPKNCGLPCKKSCPVNKQGLFYLKNSNNS